MSVLFVAGIDTGAGKTIATGLLARYLVKRGVSVITAKLAQTGCVGVSDDVALHRRLMGAKLLEEDKAGTTCPYVFSYPASPALSASLDNASIETGRIDGAVSALAKTCDMVLLEGVGGWMVPLSKTLLASDYVGSKGWPVVVVSSPRLGSINHTLLTLRAVDAAGLKIAGIAYNLGVEAPPEIVEDTRNVFGDALSAYGRKGALVDFPFVADPDDPPEVDFSPITVGLFNG